MAPQKTVPAVCLYYRFNIYQFGYIDDVLLTKKKNYITILLLAI